MGSFFGGALAGLDAAAGRARFLTSLMRASGMIVPSQARRAVTVPFNRVRGAVKGSVGITGLVMAGTIGSCSAERTTPGIISIALNGWRKNSN